MRRCELRQSIIICIKSAVHIYSKEMEIGSILPREAIKFEANKFKIAYFQSLTLTFLCCSPERDVAKKR